MSLYIQLSDLKAQTSVAKDVFTSNPLQFYLDKFEVFYLIALLGAELYKDFATDFAITGTAPTDPKFIEIWNEFQMDDSCGIRVSEGMKEMLALFIYFEWLRDQASKNNISGPQSNVQANSTATPYHATNIYTNYNEALETFKSIQWLICSNPNAYDWTKYNGQRLEIVGFI
jgi:hypothetical protein